MATIYVIFASEDHPSCNRLVDLANGAKLPVRFEFTEPKLPWVPSWKGQTRAKMFKCDGAIVLLSKKTREAVGVSWEISCAGEAQLPVLGVHIDKFQKGSLPDGLQDAQIIEWNWPEIASFIQSFTKRAWSAPA